MSIARFAVNRPVSVTMLACAIVVLGIFAYPRLPLDLLPSFQPPVVSVTVNYGNVAPETMESTVARPIENAVARVPGIDILQSDSYQGQSVVRARFKYGTDINVAAVDIQEQIARIQNQLPNDPNLQPPQIVKADPNSLPVARILVTDPTRTQRELSDLFTNQLSDEFSSVLGVGSVNTGGGPQRAIMVEPKQSLLAANNLTTNDIIRKIAAENVDDPAGIIAIGPKEFGIRTSALYKSAQEVADTVVAIRNNAPVFVRDVANVSDSVEELRSFARVDGKPAVQVIVTAQPDANVVAVSDGVRAKIAELKQRYPTMQFEILFAQDGFIRDSIAALAHTAMYGAVLAVLVILLFLHAWRSTLIVAVSLPVSVLGTLFATYMFHQSLNTMTLGGLALAVGLIVDDAVVVIENIFRHLDEGDRPKQAAENGTAQIFSAVLSSSITVITVFVPLLLIPGLQGLIFGPFALVIMSAVGISFVVAVTTVPMLSSITLRRERHGVETGETGWYARFVQAFDRGYGRFENRYRALLAWSLDRPALVLGIGAAALGIALIALRLGFVQTEVFPAADSRYARFDVRMPNGTALAITNHASALLEDAFLHDPRVQAVSAGVGAASAGSFGRFVQNQSYLSVLLRPDVTGPAATAFVSEWQARFGGGRRRGAAPASQTRHTVPPEQRARIQAAQQALKGAEVRGHTVDIIQSTVAQGADALQIQIFGPDYNELFKLAETAIPQLAQIPGVVRPDTNVTPTQPEVDVKIDRRKAAQFGFSTGDIAFQIATATSGTIASYFQINGVQYPILVQFPPSERRTLSSLSDLQLIPPAAGTGVTTGSASGVASATSGSGGGPTGGAIVTSSSLASSSLSTTTVPLSAVATINTGVGPSQISRQNKQRRIDINATILDVPLGAVVAQSAKIMNGFTLPAGYRWQFGPAITQNNDTFGALALVVALAIALIYMLLASQFESFLDPLIIMTTVPLALVGIVGSLMITHRAFGLTAFIGSLMLVGIAVKNAILVVEFTKQLRHSGMSAREALMHAGPRRLRPILMTTLATCGGMLPLALGIEVGSSTQAPLGTVVIGGLLTSTVLSLLVVPTLYLLVATRIEPRFSARPPSIFHPPSGEAPKEREPILSS